MKNYSNTMMTDYSQTFHSSGMSQFGTEARAIEELRRMYQACGQGLSKDHPHDPMEINDEVSYDLGKLHGLQIAITTLERLNRVEPRQIDIH